MVIIKLKAKMKRDTQTFDGKMTWSWYDLSQGTKPGWHRNYL